MYFVCTTKISAGPVTQGETSTANFLDTILEVLKVRRPEDRGVVSRSLGDFLGSWR